MGNVLRRLVPVTALLASGYAPAELSDRHELRITLDSTRIETRSELGAWTDAGYGKLRYSADAPGYGSTRIAVEYRAQLAATIFGRLVVDVRDEAEARFGATEAFLEWRPLPSSPLRHRLRFGAFYPELSMENTGAAWESPYTRSFSAINTWLGEEIRPVGAEWRLSRRIGPAGTPQEFGAMAGLFYGNDSAGTLLFWRGWSAHDRQTRLNERLPLPPLNIPNPSGGADIVVERRLDPIAEIDDRPGVYAGGEWQYAKRLKLSLSFYDNRGDPYAFRDGQWAWGTRFWHLAAQVSLPGDIGLIAQHMRGDTDWLVPPSSDGTLSPDTDYVTDEYDSAFVLLSKQLGDSHRVSLRYERFSLSRPGELVVDRGTARTIAYRYSVNPRLQVDVEWMEIESGRDLWPIFFGLPNVERSESLLQLGFRFIVFDSLR